MTLFFASSLTYNNPYTGSSFFDFFGHFFTRLFLLITGQLELNELASDEIQIYVISGVAVSSALIGTFLILKRMSMLANALSHTILLGIVVAYLLMLPDVHGHYQPLNVTAMMIAAVVMGIVTAFLTQFLTTVARLQEDASTGIVFTTLFAVGIILVTLLTRNAHIGTEVVMGNADALRLSDCRLVYTILGMNVLLFFLFFKEYKIVAFDPALARSMGISTFFFNYLLMIQVSATCIGAFRAIGVLMVLAFITGPVLISRLLTHDLKRLLALSSAIGVLASIIGVAWSRHLLTNYGLALSTGGLIVCVIVAFYAVVVCWTLFRRSSRFQRLFRRFSPLMCFFFFNALL